MAFSSISARLPGTLHQTLRLKKFSCAVFIGVGLLSSAQLSAQPTLVAPPALPVAVVDVKATRIPNVIEVMAQAEGAKETEVRALVGGILLQRLYEEGAPVKAGQPLFQIDPEPYKIALDEAQARARQTAREAGRLKGLFEKQAVSRKEMDDAVSADEIAQATLKRAQLNLKWTKVTAPMSGISGRAQRSEGNLVTTAADGSLLTVVYQMDPIWVRFGLSESDLALLPEGKLTASKDTTVQLLFGGNKTYPVKGTINFLSSFIDPKLGTQQFRAEFANPDGQIKPGQFLRAKIEAGFRDDAFLIPQVSVTQTAQGPMVWVIDDQGKAAPRPIRTGQWVGRDWVVLGGLREGDRVITDNLIKIRPGAPVVAKPAAPQAQLGQPVADKPAADKVQK